MANFYRLIDSVQLALRIGVATGDMVAIQVGGVYGRWEFLVAGEPMAQMGVAERLARPGEVVLAPEAWALVADRCTGTALSTESQESGDWRLEVASQSPIANLQPPRFYARLDTIHTPLAPHQAQQSTADPRHGRTPALLYPRGRAELAGRWREQLAGRAAPRHRAVCEPADV